MTMRGYRPGPEHTSIIAVYRNTLIYFILILQFSPVFYALITGRISILGNPTDFEATNDASASVVWQAIEVLMLVNSMILARFCKVPTRAYIVAMLPLLLMLFWIVLSIDWSAYPSLTLRRTIREIVELTTFTFLALSIPTPRLLLRPLFVSFAVINLMDLASMALPALSFTPIGFSGIHIHKNSAGQFFFLSLPIFALGIIDRTVSQLRTVAIFSFLTASCMLVLTLSKTAVAVLVISAFLVFLVRLFIQPNAYSRIVLPIILICSAGNLLAIIFDFGLHETLSLFVGDATLTGRDKIWAYALSVFEKSPLHGVGYGALWQVGPDVEAMLKYAGSTFIPNEGHNGYIDILAQLGYVGLMALCGFLLITFLRIIKFVQAFAGNGRVSFADYALYVFIGVLFYNITESSYFRPGHGLWFMLVFVSSFVSGYLFRQRALVRRVSGLGRAISQRKAARIQ
jgi:O-antigen ligase